MTAEEFYQYCKEHGIENYKIYVDQISVNGCFIGYAELTPDEIDIGHGERIVSIG